MLALNLACIFSLFYKLSGLQFEENSVDELAAMKQAAQILNVSLPNYWNAYMEQSTSTYSSGGAHIGSSTIDSVMANWSIPAEFRDKAVKRVRLLMLASKGH
ncbi:unnamed protein product [Rotaria sp. Silwood2]|nr:unnamed protein product [Rotaria sp. Silwood2]